MRGAANPELRLQLAAHDDQRFGERDSRQRTWHVLQRQMRRGQGNTQGRRLRTTDQQHHDARRMRACGEELRVAGERNARVHDDALLHGRRDQCRERTCRAGVGGVLQHGDHAVRIGRVRLPCIDRGGNRLMPDLHDTARGGECHRIEFGKAWPGADACRALRSNVRSPRITRRAANGASAWRCASMATNSGPMPAGSPEVIASAGLFMDVASQRL